MIRIQIFAMCAAVILGRPCTPAEDGKVLFKESFDDESLLKRGWYDGDKWTISEQSPQAGKGCIEFAWKAGESNPGTAAGSRHLFEATDSVYIRFHIKLSKGWRWTERGYHPHLIQCLTTENAKFAGPAATHLTIYVEPWNGKLRLAAQDIQNKDKPHGLTQGEIKGGFNGKTYDSKENVFTDEAWHCVEAYYKLNTLDTKADKPNADGIVRGWFDGKLVIDRSDVILRSTDFPAMKFNQFLLAPYFGPGLLPQAQTMWLDELEVASKRPEPEEKK